MSNFIKGMLLGPLIFGLAVLIFIAAGLSTVTGGYNATDCKNVSNIIAPGRVKSVSAKGLEPEQLKIGGQIISIGVQRGFSRRDIKIALQTGYQESTLKNLDYGDRDSLGIYQQRHSKGWGTPEQITDPVYAINKFYDALERVKNRDEMDPFEVAMKVQIPSRAAYLSPGHNWNSWATMAEELLNSAELPAGEQSAEPMAYADDCVDRDAVKPSKDGWQRPLDRMNVSSVFGERFHPIRKVMKLHDGTDFPAASGTPLYSLNNGKVVERDTKTAEGNYIKIDYGDGNVITYMHMSRFSNVAKGDSVEAGTIVGYVGSTGFSTGPHLHLSWYRNGEPIDPVPQLCKRGIVIAGSKGCTNLSAV